METKRNDSEYTPKFNKSFRHPRHQGAWLSVAVMAGIVLTPPELRDPTLARLGRFAGRLGENSHRRALVNLSLCFPERSEAECEATIDEIFAIIPQAMVMTAELAIRGSEETQSRVDWQGLEAIEEIRRNNEKVIFLVPHGWVVDVPAMPIASQRQKVTAMFHNQGGPAFGYIWSTVRHRSGGRLHARNDGIKPFIQSVRQGYQGYYLPDQDHGPEHNEFVGFLATYKATLPTIDRLMRVCRAHVVPLFPIYDNKTHHLTVQVRLPMDDLSETDGHTIAQRMNEEVEIFVGS